MIHKNTIIAFLLLSATVLSCVLFFELVLPGTETALAGNTGKIGSLAVATATFKLYEDVLWIADGSTQRLIICETTRSGKIRVTADKDLADIFAEKKGNK